MLYLYLETGFFYKSTFTIHDLDHMNILGINNQNVFSRHREPGLHRALKADEIFICFTDGFRQCLHIGDTDFFMAGQQHVNISILNVALPNGLLLGHSLVVKAVDEYLIAVNFVAALHQTAQIRSLQVPDGGVQCLTLSQITMQVFAFCIDHKTTLPLQNQKWPAAPFLKNVFNI